MVCIERESVIMKYFHKYTKERLMLVWFRKKLNREADNEVFS